MNRCILCFSALLLFATTVFAQGSVDKREVYKDKNETVERRVADLLGRMTLQEKIHQMENMVVGDMSRIEQTFNGNSYGCTHDMSLNAKECADKYKLIQEYMKTKTRLGIPILTACEGIEGVLQNGCTIFPHALALGSTFDPALAKEMTLAAGAEAKVIGINQILSPVLDIARDLRWGRVEETLGEDPFLIAEMAIGYVDGYQSLGITCTPKHFMAHGSPTGGLNCANVSGGERELRMLYLYPFERVIKQTNPLSVMTCYSSYDGVASVGSPYYMTQVLREDLGFKGYLYSDWGSVEHLKTFHFAAGTLADAAKMAVEAGVDLNVDSAYENLEELVKSGRLDVKYIDRAVGYMLSVKFKLGLFDNSFGQPEKVEQVVHNSKHVALAKKIAAESAILLENKNSILPLDLSKYRSIAVVGPNADQTVFGDYSWTTGDSDYGVNLLDGLRSAIGDKAKISYQMGCDWWSGDKSGFKAALDAAQQSDLVIVAVGTRSTYLARNPKNVTSGEGFDLSSLELPGVQADLIKEIKACGKPVIVVLISGKPLAIPWVKENADAVIAQWYGGEQQGSAMADIILGRINPSGRLNVSFPRSTGNAPCYYNYLPTDRGHFGPGGTPEEPKGHYIFEQPYALWPFGYGLSYTNFEYKSCLLNKNIFTDKETLSVVVEVANTGKIDGKEVVQLYVRDKISSVATPVRQLKAFKKELIRSGKSVKVELQVPISELSLYNQAMQRVVEPGEFEIQIGRSSDDIVFRETITVCAPES